MFYRLHADGTSTMIDLRNFFGGPKAMPCWMIGAGPSLLQLPVNCIRESPCPKFSMNLAGSGLIRPNFWTSYDPTVRFHPSLYLDPSIIKFVHRCRAMDLVPGTMFKVCDCPATLFFDRDREIGFRNFTEISKPRIVDWQDSFVQAIQIAFAVGFRTLLLAGCEFYIRPAKELLATARSAGVQYQEKELLGNFIRRCRDAGLSEEALESAQAGRSYHFDETKTLSDMIQADFHYFRVAQYLRLSLRSIVLSGLNLVSVTPNSRLNDYFPYSSIDDALELIGSVVGKPDSETTHGCYSKTIPQHPAGVGPMQDFLPHFWKNRDEQVKNNVIAKRGKVAAIEELPEIPVEIEEAP